MHRVIGMLHWVAVLILAAMLIGCAGPSVRTSIQADFPEGLYNKSVLPGQQDQRTESVSKKFAPLEQFDQSTESLANKSIPPVQLEQRRSIIGTANAMRGRAYRWGGKSPQRGFDCSGLVYFAHQKVGISVPRMSRKQLSQSTRVAVNRIQPGDLLFFKINSNVSHVGIYIGERNFIHAPSRGKYVSLSSLDSSYWRRRFYAAGHFYSR